MTTDPNRHSDRDKPALTGLRGVAALWVVLYHNMAEDGTDRISTLSQSLGPISTLLDHGYLAVDIFFCLSGFVIAFSYEKLIRNFTRDGYARFLLRRVARIYPLYFVATILAFAKQIHDHLASMHASDIVLQIVTNLLLIDAWGFNVVPVVGPSWSISTEFASYLLFPLLAGAIVCARPRIAFPLTIAFFLSLVAATYAAVPPTEAKVGPLDVYWASSGWPLLRCVAGFSFGLFAFRLGKSAHVVRWVSTPVASTVLTIAAIGIAAVPNTDLILVALTPFVLLALLDANNPVARVLGTKFALTLGRLSYSIYLLHVPLMPLKIFLERRMPARLGTFETDIVASIAYYVVLFVVAELGYRAIEDPGRRFIRGFEKRHPTVR